MSKPVMTAPVVLVLGATGHIGRHLALALHRAGFAVRGLARAPGAVTRADGHVDWRFGDLAGLTTATAWQPIIVGCTAMVNSAGALQDGLDDRLAAVHGDAIAALCAAAQGSVLQRVVQISAPGVDAQASTAFNRTKAKGDDALRASGLPWIILRPVIVVGPDAYGGTALLRALAAFPLAMPAIHARQLVPTVHVDDVAEAVVMAVQGRLPSGTDVMLTEPHGLDLASTLRLMRRWLGLADAPVIAVPATLSAAVARCADLAGRLGWRSPLRSTALTLAGESIAADPEPWRKLTGKTCKSLAESLAAMPATHQERWFARLYLLKALAVLLLAVFWITSGLLGLWSASAAEAVLTTRGLSHAMAQFAVLGGSLADLALGLAALFRPWAKAAFTGMIGLSLLYLIGGTAVAPDLWLDPLGPLVKVIPAIGLAAVARALMAER